MRSLLIRQRTALINQIRGLLGERGLTIARTPQAFRRARPDRLREADNELTAFCRSLITELQQHLREIEARIGRMDRQIQAFMRDSGLCNRIAAIEGIGPITATAIIGAIGDAREFRNGRHLAAWLGLVPRQYSSGGKSRLQGISKRGDRYLRTLLIHGARAVLRYVAGTADPRSCWLQRLMARRGYNCAAVALANKNARIIQVLLAKDLEYGHAAVDPQSA